MLVFVSEITCHWPFVEAPLRYSSTLQPSDVDTTACGTLHLASLVELGLRSLEFVDLDLRVHEARLQLDHIHHTHGGIDVVFVVYLSLHCIVELVSQHDIADVVLPDQERSQFVLVKVDKPCHKSRADPGFMLLNRLHSKKVRRSPSNRLRNH